MPEKIGRRERKKQQSRQAILDAAVREFSRKGFKDTSIADVMNAADLGIGTFYNYFSSKEDLLINLLSQFAQSMQEMALGMQAEGCPAVELLTTACNHTAKFLDDNRFVLPLFLSAAAHSAMPEGAGTKLRPVSPGFQRVFADIIAYGQKAGTFRDDMPAELITELFHSIFQAASFSRLKYSFRENIALKLKVLIDGIVKNNLEGAP